MADARLGHDRDGHGLHDLGDQQRVAHARHATRRADVRRHTLERHHCDRAGVLSDLGVLGRDDVHDHAALEHLGETLLGRPGRLFFAHARMETSGWSRQLPPWPIISPLWATSLAADGVAPLRLPSPAAPWAMLGVRGFSRWSGPS